MKINFFSMIMVSISMVCASDNVCDELSNDFVESGYFKCVNENENISSFFKCLYRENLRKDRTDKGRIEQEITSIALMQNESIKFLQKEGIIKEDYIDKAFMSISKRNYYIGPKLKKAYLFSKDTNDMKKDDYICYLKKLKNIQCDLTSRKSCDEWYSIIDRELLLHQQPPINCFCLLKEYEKDYSCSLALSNPWIRPEKWESDYEQMIMDGVERIKNECNEYNVTKSIAMLINDSLEDFFWVSAREHKLFNAYLKNYSNGKFKDEAKKHIMASYIPINEFVKKIEKKIDDGVSINTLLASIKKYQDEFEQTNNDSLNALIEKYSSIKDTISALYTLWVNDFNHGRTILPNCSFKTSSDTYSVEMNDLSKLPEKNGSLSCYYPLFSYTGERKRPLYDEDYDVEEIFSVVNLEATIKNKKISSGIEYGFDPVEYKLNYNSSYENGKKKGYFKLNNLIEINYNNENYVIEFLDDEDKEMTLLDVQNMFYLLGKNTCKLKHLSPNSLLDEDGKEKISFTKGKITAVSSVSKNRKITLPLNNQGEINGIIKYWDSNVGEVEMSVQANKPRVDDKGNTKVSKVKIRGCTFTPPRKVIGYEKHKWGKSAIYEKFSKQCESVADEVGMNILLEPMISHTYTYSAFIPVFLVDFLDWNNIK